MALDSATETLVITPELWSQTMVDYMYAQPVVMNRVHRVDGEVSYGSKLNLPQMPTMTVADVTKTTGAVTDQDYTYTEIELSIDQWRVNVINLVKMASIQANRDVIADFRRQVPDSLMADIDAKLLALHGDITTYTQGDANTLPSEDLLTAAVADLLGANLGSALRDPNRVSFIFHTSLWKYCKKVPGWNDASLTGEALGGRLKATVPDLYGIPMFFSSQVVSSTGRRNLLMCREALALGIQKGITIEQVPFEGLSTKIAAHVLFGVKAYNEARAVKITTAIS